MEASLLLDLSSHILLWVFRWLLSQTKVWSLDYICVEQQINFLPCVLFVSLDFHRYTAIRTQTSCGLCCINLSIIRNRKSICRKWKWHCSEFFSSKDGRMVMIVAAKKSDSKRDNRDFNFLYTFWCFLYIQTCILCEFF